MFNGQWKRTHADTLEQLCFVLEIKENDKIAELEMLLNANLSTIIDEEDDQITVFHRFVFDLDNETEDSRVIKFNQLDTCTAMNGEKVQSSYHRSGIASIEGHEGDFSITYRIDGSRLIQTIKRGHHQFRQISEEIFY
ncbi:Oidioi.mRNA.OKI2018_I69.PAR.g11973.t1.cds [Oikopleura dioica]|uniref:Oidioi.mRNA.OKI2018_I69.PAR.g11973.t1.cds n=1 Tax=Oikopleura dioica TaxID=34765 RepID=A0ABN7RYQ7_OIKDI|nr:Oidioi.mRNA.OKI2018_I69.PAR.g11973.t1.cds [Oikopleura dioica]